MLHTTQAGFSFCMFNDTEDPNSLNQLFIETGTRVSIACSVITVGY